MKLNTAGDSVWSRRYDFTGESDIAVSVTTNTSGTAIFVTGYSDASPTSYKNWDIATLKFNASGVQQAIVRYNNVANGPDKPVKIFFSSNNLFIAGTTWNGTSNNLLTLKYNTSLAQQYASEYSLGVAGNVTADNIFVDAGTAYVCGHTNTVAESDNYITLKYNSTGVQQWATAYNGPASLTDKPSAIIVSSSGVFVTGRSANSAADSCDIVTIKYDKTSGAQIWLNRFSNLVNSDDRGNAISIDKFNNISVAGRCTNASGYFDMVSVIFDPSGKRLFTAIYSGTGAGEDYASAEGFSSEGYLYVAGYTSNATLNFDLTTLKYCTPSIAYAGPDATICKNSSVTLSGGGGTTYSWSPATGLNNTTIANPSAKPLVTTTYVVTVNNGLGCGPATTDTVVVTVNPQPTATITAGGPLTFCIGLSVTLTANAGAGYTYQWYNGATAIAGATNISYTATTSGAYKVEVFNTFGCSKKSGVKTVTTIVCDTDSGAGTSSGVNIYPVPFSNATVLYASPADPVIAYTIYDVTGKEVESRFPDAGSTETEIAGDLQPGMYFVTVRTNSATATIKIVKSN